MTTVSWIVAGRWLTALGGPSNSAGTVFRLAPDGTLTTLYAFTDRTDGEQPQALTQGSDGNLYGVTSQGTVVNNGVIFEVLLRPAITSSVRAVAATGQPFRYSIQATGQPTSYAADGLPPGLNLDSATGLISGMPTQVGSYSVDLSATNDGGTGTAVLVLTVSDALPVATLTTATPSVTIGSGKGIVTVNLSAPAANDVTVNFKIKGSAVRGTDYALKTSKKIKAGSAAGHSKSFRGAIWAVPTKKWSSWPYRRLTAT